MTNTQHLIAEIAKGPAVTVRVAIVSYSGKVGVDVREFAVWRSTGEVGPTKAGLRIPPAMIDELIAALAAARDALPAHTAAATE